MALGLVLALTIGALVARTTVTVAGVAIGLTAAAGITSIAIARTGSIRAVATGTAAVAAFLSSLNALRPIEGATLADPLFVVAAALLLVLSATERLGPPLPRWLIAAAGLLLTASLLTELLPPDEPSQAALLFPGEIFSGRGSTEVSRVELSNLGAVGRLLFAAVLVPVVIAYLANSSGRIALITNAWLAGVVTSCVVAILDYAGFNIAQGVLGLPAVGNEEGIQRATGLTSHPNTLGLTAAMALPLVVAGGLRHSGNTRLAFAAGAAILLAGLVLSGSRAAIAAAVLAMLVLLLWNRGQVRVVLFRVAALATVAVALILALPNPLADRLVGDDPGASISANERATILPVVLEEVSARPFFGYGFEYVRGSQNVVVQVLHAGGLLALLGMMCLVGGAVSMAWKARAWGAPELSGALVAALAAWGAAGLLQPAVFDRFIYVPVGLLIATAMLQAATSAPPLTPTVETT